MKPYSWYIFAVLICIFMKKVQSEIVSQEDLVKKLTEALEALKNIGQKSTNDIGSDNDLFPKTNEPELKNEIFDEFGENNGKIIPSN